MCMFVQPWAMFFPLRVVQRREEGQGKGSFKHFFLFFFLLKGGRGWILVVGSGFFS